MGDPYISRRRLPTASTRTIATRAGAPLKLQRRRPLGRRLLPHAAGNVKGTHGKHRLARFVRLSTDLRHGAFCLHPRLRGA